MKILVALSSLYSGGAERVACTLAEAWTERGDEVILLATFSGKGHCFYPLSDRVRVVYLADLVGTQVRSLANRLHRLGAYRRMLREERPDVIVSFLPGVNVASVLASRGLGIPLIACERTDPVAWPMPLWKKRLYGAVYRQADMLTVQTESVAQRLPAVFPGLKAVRVVPNPVPQPVQDHVSGAGAAHAPGVRRRLAAMGRLSEEKQFDLLIDVFAGLATRRADWDLVIYGEGPLKDCLQARIAQAGLCERVTLAGATRSPWPELARSDVFVMTSRIEGFPNALLEAMALGLPCAVFDCQSGPREITREGSDALLIPLNDKQELTAALDRLMTDPVRRLTLGMQARASVLARYSLPVVLGYWDRMFDEVRSTSKTAGRRERQPEVSA